MPRRNRKPRKPMQTEGIQRRRKDFPMLDTIVVDNPAEYAERVVHPKVTAIRTLRDDAIGLMHARGHLGRKDSEEAHGRLARARLFQETWEISGRNGPIKSPEFMPGGGSDPAHRSGTTDRRLRAGNQLDRWARMLGDTGFSLLKLILIDKHTITEAARIRHGQANGTTVNFTGHRLRECLDELA
jgi:hypothetical protein